MPIVFCASLVPCASETSDAEPHLAAPEPGLGALVRDTAGDPVDQPGALSPRRRWPGSRPRRPG